jgi:hypothetical protein
LYSPKIKLAVEKNSGEEASLAGIWQDCGRFYLVSNHKIIQMFGNDGEGRAASDAVDREGGDCTFRPMPASG